MDDPDILAWAAQKSRVVLTHDVKTMIRFGSERIASGLSMAGLFIESPPERPEFSTREDLGKVELAKVQCINRLSGGDSGIDSSWPSPFRRASRVQFGCPDELSNLLVNVRGFKSPSLLDQ